MVEENPKEKVKEKVEKKVAEAEKEIAKDVAEIEEKVEEHKITQKQADKKINEEVAEETKSEKKEIKEEKTKKKEKKAIIKKSEAVVNARDLPISTKHSIALCNFIRGKTIDEAMFLLTQVLHMKMAVPMKGEIPHRKGKIMSGRYPIKAAQHFFKLLKQLSANATVNGIEIEKVRIECKANRASRPYKRFGSEKFKRSHVNLKVKIKKQNNLKKQ